MTGFDELAGREQLEAVIGIGSNLGDRLANLQYAVDVLEAHDDIKVLGVSPVYETEPVGGPDQGPFLNAVVRVVTQTDPTGLLALAHQIEDGRGRVREQRWGPRTLDVDLLTVADLVAETTALTLPHPRAHERAFVLAPWCDLDPDAVIVGIGTVRELLTQVSRDGVRRRDDLQLHPGGSDRPAEGPAAS